MKSYLVKKGNKLKLPAGTQYKGVKNGWHIYYHPLFGKYWFIKKTILGDLLVKEERRCQC
ncbi:MAG: hypothetical protein LWW95_08415 [Candidatus Desulfofervidus auxilii]|nr:hypothetical protein [Candidatus Desulfofervidus auxilii]